MNKSWRSAWCRNAELSDRADAHTLMLRAIAAAKKKNDRMDAHKIADCLQCDFLPESCMASTEISERRRTLRYRNLLVRQLVQMKDKIAVLLTEAGVAYNKRRLHKVGHFRNQSETIPGTKRVFDQERAPDLSPLVFLKTKYRHDVHVPGSESRTRGIALREPNSLRADEGG